MVLERRKEKRKNENYALFPALLLFVFFSHFLLPNSHFVTKSPLEKSESSQKVPWKSAKMKRKVPWKNVRAGKVCGFEIGMGNGESE